MSDVVISVENLGKKFCRSLKGSLWFGMQDIAAELLGSRDVRQLRKDEFWAVNDVSFNLGRGECLGLIGPNGSGKSTLLKMLNGLIKLDRGRITMRGKVGALIELGAGFNPILTGRENIYINASVLGYSKKDTDRRLEGIIDFAGIDDFIDTPVQNYSSGMKIRLGFAVASQMEPDILIIDEVLAVGDKGFIVKCMNHLWKLKNNGTSIILVSHNMYHINAFADKAILLNKGCIELHGEPQVVTGHYETMFFQNHMEDISCGIAMNVHFRDASINSKSFQDNGVVLTGECFELVINFDIMSKLMEGLAVGVTFRSNDGQIVAGFIVNQDDFGSAVDAGSYSLYVTVRNNIFLEGRYSVGVSAFNVNYTQNLGFAEPVITIRCRTDNFDPLKMVGKVMIEKSATIVRSV